MACLHLSLAVKCSYEVDVWSSIITLFYALPQPSAFEVAFELDVLNTAPMFGPALRCHAPGSRRNWRKGAQVQVGVRDGAEADLVRPWSHMPLCDLVSFGSACLSCPPFERGVLLGMPDLVSFGSSGVIRLRWFNLRFLKLSVRPLPK